MLYDETDHEAAAAKRASIVARAECSDAANRKQTTGRTADGLPVHSFQTLLADLGTYCRIHATTPQHNRCAPAYRRDKLASSSPASGTRLRAVVSALTAPASAASAKGASAL
jgi:hypothetical protein